jgi:hypothetical protein
MWLVRLRVRARETCVALGLLGALGMSAALAQLSWATSARRRCRKVRRECRQETCVGTWSRWVFSRLVPIRGQET